jgi:Fe-S cluster assembly protein SufD
MSHGGVLKEALLEDFRRRAEVGAERDPKWLRSARERHLARFSEIGFPTIREEDWKNTNVSAIADTRFRPAATAAAVPHEIVEPVEIVAETPRAVFVDGRFSAERSSTAGLPDGVRVGSLARELSVSADRLRPYLTRARSETSPAFRAINAAMTEDGGLVWIPDGVVFDRPLQLIFVSTGVAQDGGPSVSHPRSLIVVGRSSQVTVQEIYIGGDEKVYLTNAATELGVGDGAVLRHYRVQLESEQGYHVSTVESVQGPDSRYAACHVNLGGRLVRNELRSILDGKGASCTLDGLCLTRGRQHLDNHTVLDHAEPHCDSREVFKSILGGKSRSVFSGRIIVRPDAQKTDAKQSNPNLLLSTDALAHTRPQLEIYADDVKCTHGATIGRLDEGAIFYLRSRGIPSDEARRLLVEAFAAEILDKIEPGALRDFLHRTVRDRLRESMRSLP